MEKLIIKAVICNTHYGDHHELKACWHTTPEEKAKEAKRAKEAGAAIVHFHEPWKDGKPMGLEGWQETTKLIREACGDVIIEHGQGGMPYNIRPTNPQRDPKNDLRIEHKLGLETMVCSLGLIDHTLLGPDGLFTDASLDHIVQSLTRRQFEDNCRYYRECGIKPRLETFGMVGPFRNLEWIVPRGALDPPYCLTWNFGMTGIAGDPATLEYLKQRIAAIPAHLKDDIVAEVSVYQPGASRLLLHSYAIAEGFHVRIGMEDMPLYWEGVPAKNNVELVERVVRLAKEFHREVATPAEARQMLRLPSDYPRG